ncbi:hypothetical protein PT974_02804 [Cladobotryum mycophilum]|uniref:Kinetochore-associated protein MTW1 n=1 Tax=Cladobotryum mycophilum TaxID=491253 RepID=A0ABR0T0B8_9HYPO
MEPLETTGDTVRSAAAKIGASFLHAQEQGWDDSLLDDIINTVNVLADRALDSVERLLLSIPPQKLGFASKKSKSKNADPESDLPPDEASKLEIENGTHQLETLLNASIDKNFDIFELYVMQNIINVRAQDQPFMRLSHYEGLDFPSSSALQQQQQEDKPTPESITALRRRLQASQKLNIALEAEKARNEVLLHKLRSLLGVKPSGEGVKNEEVATAGGAPFGFLRDKGGLEEGGGDQPITTTTEFTLSQLQSVRSLSKSLQKLLPDLVQVTDPENGGKAKSWRRERAEFIESSSRKYLETVGGLELGPGGDIRDGDWQGEGRGLSKGEVEGLEKVVVLLGGTKDSPNSSAAVGESSDAMDES